MGIASLTTSNIKYTAYRVFLARLGALGLGTLARRPAHVRGGYILPGRVRRLGTLGGFTRRLGALGSSTVGRTILGGEVGCDFLLASIEFLVMVGDMEEGRQ